MATPHWLAIRFVALPLEAVGESYVSPCATAIVEKNRVYALNRQAKAHGIQIGMSTSQARLICELNILERDAKQEKIRLQQLAHWAYRFTSLVCIYRTENHHLNTLVLEIGGSQRLFSNNTQLFDKVKNGLEGMAIHAQLGDASSAKGAYVASADLSSSDPNRHQFNAHELVTVEALDIPYKTTQQLHQCGLFSLADIKNIPRQQLNQRFSPALSHYLDQLFNREPDPLFTHGAADHIVPPEHFFAQLDFAQPISNHQWINLELENLLNKFIKFLEKRQWLCQTFTWRLLGERNKCLHTLTIELASKHTELATFKELTDLKLANIDLSQELHGIELIAKQFIAKQLWVDDLFDSQHDDREITSLIDRLHSRLGDNSVLKLHTLSEHLPEEGNRLSALDYSSDCFVANNHSKYESDVVLASAPVWLLKKPTRLAVRDKQPMHQGTLKIIYGPQRINEKWWMNKSTKDMRDYFIARQQDGRLFWIFYQHQEKAWYLHGLYG
jgi:protein ImuB